MDAGVGAVMGATEDTSAARTAIGNSNSAHNRLWGRSGRRAVTS